MNCGPAEHYWGDGTERYKDGDTLDFVTCVIEYKGDGKQIVSEPVTHNFMFINPAPNPFSSKCTIEYAVFDEGHKPQNMSIAIFNLFGKKVATLYSGESSPGIHRIVWKPEKVAAGNYLIIVNYGKKQMSRQVVYLPGHTSL